MERIFPFDNACSIRIIINILALSTIFVNILHKYTLTNLVHLCYPDSVIVQLAKISG